MTILLLKTGFAELASARGSKISPQIKVCSSAALSILLPEAIFVQKYRLTGQVYFTHPSLKCQVFTLATKRAELKAPLINPAHAVRSQTRIEPYPH
jgi:hypothetical protein